MSERAPLRPRDATRHPPALTPGYRSTALRAPLHRPISLPSTPTELHGPVFGESDLGPLDADLLANFARPGYSPIGPRIRVHGRVLDGEGRPVPRTLVEIWQANAGGRYRHPRESYIAPLDEDFGGCGRALTDGEGYYAFRTVMPAAYPFPNGPNSWRPAHIHFSVFGSGFGQRLVTQMYFAGDPLIPLCPIAGAIPDAAALDRLTARLDMDAARPFNALAWRFDVTLRGPAATPTEAP